MAKTANTNSKETGALFLQAVITEIEQAREQAGQTALRLEKVLEFLYRVKANQKTQA